MGCGQSTDGQVSAEPMQMVVQTLPTIMANNTFSEIREIVENSLKYSEASYKNDTGKSFPKFLANLSFLGKSVMVQNQKIIPRASTCLQS